MTDSPVTQFLFFLLYHRFSLPTPPPHPPPPIIIQWLCFTAHMSSCKYERAAFQSVGGGGGGDTKMFHPIPQPHFGSERSDLFSTPHTHTPTHMRGCVSVFPAMLFFCPQGRGHAALLHTHFVFMLICHPRPSWLRASTHSYHRCYSHRSSTKVFSVLKHLSMFKHKNNTFEPCIRGNVYDWVVISAGQTFNNDSPPTHRYTGRWAELGGQEV